MLGYCRGGDNGGKAGARAPQNNGNWLNFIPMPNNFQNDMGQCCNFYDNNLAFPISSTSFHSMKLEFFYFILFDK